MADVQWRNDARIGWGGIMGTALAIFLLFVFGRQIVALVLPITFVAVLIGVGYILH